MKRHKMKCLIIFLVFVLTFLLPYIPKTSSKYIEKQTKKITINAVQPTYTIHFDANGGSGNMEDQVFTYNTADDLHQNTFFHETKGFIGWNTIADGTGVFYNDCENIYNLSSTNGETITFYAQWIDKIARIDDTFYDSLAEAITAANNTGGEVEIILLKSTNENITIPNTANITLNLHGNTLGNVGNDNTIKNYGTFILKNGNIINDSVTNGAINNYSTGTITISGVNVRVYDTGNRQAFYNERGVAIITGGSVLTSISNARPAVSNISGSTMTIDDATIISTASSGLKNEGNLTLGSGTDGVNNSNPYIKGVTYGLETNKNVVFYDGILMGKTKAVDNPNRLTQVPVGYYAVDAEEVFDGTLYYEKFVDKGAIVTFNPEGGYIKSTDETKIVGVNREVGTLPNTVANGKVFDGWYTEANEGEVVLPTRIISVDTTFHAHWANNSCVAKIGDTTYDTLQEAIDASIDNEPTSIELLKDTTEILTVSDTKIIELILGNNKITNVGNKAIITNSGTLSIVGGLLTSDADTAMINHLSGTLDIRDIEMHAIGTRQTLYITSGEVTISGDSYLTSLATGTASNTPMQRGTVQCLPDGILNITGGTIISENQHAVTNEGILTIGVKDGEINTSYPTLIGKVDGIRSNGTLNFYDGTVKGKTNAINAEVNDIEEDAVIINDNIDGYKVAYLEKEDVPDTNMGTLSLTRISTDEILDEVVLEDNNLDNNSLDNQIEINNVDENILDNDTTIIDEINEEDKENPETEDSILIENADMTNEIPNIDNTIEENIPLENNDFEITDDEIVK